jgi:hypothetical protein
MKPMVVLICFLAVFLWGCGNGGESSRGKNNQDLEMGDSINTMKQKAVDAAGSAEKHMDETEETASE